MRKKFVLIAFLSIFIIFSLSFQPMIADEPIKTNRIINDLKTKESNINYLKESYIRFYNEKFQSNNDCNCGNNDIKKFICDIIDAILEAFYFIMDILQIFLYHFIPNIAGYLDIIKLFLPIVFLLPLYIILDCGPIYPPWFHPLS